MATQHVIEQLPAYALGALDEAELLAVARHLPGCPACRAELAEWYRTADALSTAIPMREPPADLRARVALRVENAASAQAAVAARPANSIPARESPSRAGGWQGFLAWLAPRRALGAAALLALVVLISTNLLLLAQYNNLRAAQPPAAAQDVRLIQLKATGAAPLATGYMIAFPGENDGSLTVDDLPALDSGKQYQIWLIKDGKRDSGGVFSVNDAGYGVLHITARQPLDSYDGFGITVEPAGGSPAPTGEKVLGTE